MGGIKQHTRLVSKVAPNDLLYCSCCSTWRVAADFPTRYTSGRSASGANPNYMPRCKGCQRVGNALRQKVGGGLKFPSVQTIRDAVLGGTSVPVTPKKQSAGHKRPQGRKRKVPSDIQAARGMVRDWEAQQRKDAQGFVYCISDGTAVKIGYSVNPPKRVPELQTGNPRILALLGSKPGTEADEAALHAKYAHLNILQEWFRPTKALLSEFNIKEASTA